MARKPLWVWLPDQAEPTQAGTLTLSTTGYALTYEADFIKNGIGIDPIALRLGPRPISSNQMPGVIVDASVARHSRSQFRP